MTKAELTATGIITLIHVVTLIVGFLTLIAVFEFPDVLREPAEYRFKLFTENQSVIVPTYFFLAMTGFTQIIVSVLLFQLMGRQSTIVTLGAVFGVLCGTFQAMGFIRWAILMPFIANAEVVSTDSAAFIEGAFNRYAGMAIGEHFGFFMQAAWTLFVGLAMMRTKLFARSLAWAGIVIGVITFLYSLEPLGGPLATLGELTNPGMSAYLVWMTFIAISLFRTNPQDQKGPSFGIIAAGAALLFWAAFAVPAYL